MAGAALLAITTSHAQVEQAPEAPAATEDHKTCKGWERQIRIYDGTDEDVQAACEGMRRATWFFSNLGYKTTAPFKITFQDEVDVPGVDGAGAETFTEGVRVVGFFDPPSREIKMTRLSSEWLRQRPYFKVPHQKELIVSVLSHEIVHALSKSFYRYKVNPAHKAQEEYIAYAAQLSMMDPEVREYLIRQYPPVDRKFGTENSINEMVHAMKPHEFGIKSYHHFISKQGGKKFLERIYTGDYKPMDMSHL